MIDSANECTLQSNTNNSYHLLASEITFDSGLLSKSFQSSVIQDYFKSSSNLSLRPSNAIDGIDDGTLRKKEDNLTNATRKQRTTHTTLARTTKATEHF